MTLPDNTQQKSDNPPLPAKTKILKVRGVWLPAKHTPLFSIKYFTICWFPPSSMSIISDKIQYPVSNCFTKDKYLNCFFRSKWRVKNSTRDYTFIQCSFINAKTYLININILMFRVGGISYLGIYQNVVKISTKSKLYFIINCFVSLIFLALVMWKNSQAMKK